VAHQACQRSSLFAGFVYADAVYDVTMPDCPASGDRITLLTLDHKRQLIDSLSQALGTLLLERGMMVATAESCTGGWASEAITGVPGSSAWFDRGFVTYSNHSKKDLLGVKASSIERFGAVSEKVVCEMAKGAVKHSRAAWAVAISGIAGPDGGTADKPVGTVWIAWASRSGVESAHWIFEGDRAQVRANAVMAALQGLITRVRETAPRGVPAPARPAPMPVPEEEKESSPATGEISSDVA
jgi:nicotinamide-nucleotide amidase